VFVLTGRLLVNRAKQERRSGVSGICPHVFSQKQVGNHFVCPSGSNVCNLERVFFLPDEGSWSSTNPDRDEVSTCFLNIICCNQQPVSDVSDCVSCVVWFSLPWQGLKAGTKKQKYDKISEKKMSTSIEV